MKIIALDTEFNSKKEILSLGLYSNDSIKKEIYFSNNVDKFTYKIHCLKSDFLLNEGLSYKKSDYDFIEDYDYIIGFDIIQDFETLQFKKYGKLYHDKKVIDLKIVLEALNISVSLDTMLSVVDIKDSLMHSAYFDAKLTYKSFEKLFELSEIDSLDIFLIKCAELTYSKEFDQAWLFDTLKYSFPKINLKKDQLEKPIKNINKLDIFLNGDFIFLFHNEDCMFRFPKKYYNGDTSNIQIKEDIPNIGIKFKDSISGGI